MMKKMRVFSLVMACILVLAACGGNSSGNTGTPSSPASTPDTPPAASSGGDGGAEYEFTIGTSATKDSAIGKAMQYTADLIAERTDGRIQITCYPDSQLGSDAELVEGVQMGNITMVIGNTAPQVTFVPALALFDLPNTYDDISVAQSVLSQFTGAMEQSFNGTDLHLCQIFPTVFRVMSCSKEVRSINDFSGIKIRTMTNNNHMEYWNRLGATATPVDFSELYIGLQQGMVDAQENPLDIFLSSKFYEQQDYLINTKHIAFVATLLMNQATWDSLPADLQGILNECFVEIGQYATSTAQAAEADNVAAAKAQGVTIIDLDDATIDAMKEKAAPVYDMIRQQVGDELVDNYLAAIESASK